MSEDEEGGSEAVDMVVDWLKSPSRGFSSMVFGLGLWGLVLGLVNLFCGAVVAGERKVVWAGWLTMGWLWDEPYADFEGASASFRPYSDTVFLAMAVLGVVWGAWGLHQRVEGGFQAWIKGVLLNPIWTSLVSGDEKGGMTMTAAAWCLVTGLFFYAYWAIVHWAWVDIGVYAVTSPILAFGFGLRYLALVEDAENSFA